MTVLQSPLIKIERRFSCGKVVPCEGSYYYRATVYEYTTEWMDNSSWKEWRKLNIVEVDV